MKIVVLDANTLGNDIHLEKFPLLRNAEIFPATKPEEVSDRISDCEVIVLNKVKLSEKNLSLAKNLQLICITATGYDNVDVEYCKNRGIYVCNVVGYSTESVAQVTVATALSLWMHLSCFERYVRDGRYTASGVQNCLYPAFLELNGKTWGIIGYGNIGKKVGEIARAIGCRVIYMRRSEDQNAMPLDTILREADIISVHTPLSEETRHLIGKEELSKMKPGAILVNAARGAVLDEEAVCEAILNETLAGFGTDVYSTEPIPAGHPFEKLYHSDRVLFTPHMAWGAYEARRRCIEEIEENIRAYFAGEKRNRVV